MENVTLVVLEEGTKGFTDIAGCCTSNLMPLM